MKFTNQQQYGLLLVLYLHRAGRARIAQVSEELEIPYSFLEQVARKLRLAGLLVSQRGPGGGFSVSGEPTMGEVIGALKGPTSAKNGYTMSRSPEKRALGQYFASIRSALTPIMNRKVKTLNMELAANESAAMLNANNRTVN